MGIEGTINAGAEARSAFRENQHRFFFRLLVRWFLFSTKYLPVWFMRAAGMPFVFFFMAFNYKNTSAVIGNMARIMPGTSKAKAFYYAAALFKNYAFYLIDLFYMSHDAGRLKEYKIIETGKELMWDAIGSGRGLILLTNHIGNWEIGGPMSVYHYGKGINLVYSPDSSAPLEFQRRRVRDVAGINEIPLKSGEFSSLKLLRVLQAGGLVALQGDRLTFDSGVAVDFFGSEATFPKGPAKLAMLTGALLVPVFIPITGYKRYEIIVDDPIELDGSLELKENMSKIIKTFEKYVKRYPTQWFTFMPFWNEDRR